MLEWTKYLSPDLHAQNIFLKTETSTQSIRQTIFGHFDIPGIHR